MMSGEQSRNFDLQERLVEYAVRILNLVEVLPDTLTGKHVAGQLVRSGTSTAANYGEAQGAESRKDFIHKMKVVLKELRETYVCLKIIHRTNLFKTESQILKAKTENNELISIFVKSVETAQKNNKN